MDRSNFSAICARASCVLAAALLLSGCTLIHAVRQPPHFAATPASTGSPPVSGLLLWLEGASSIETDSAGRVTRWRDGLVGARVAVPQFGFSGTVITATIPTPNGPNTVSGLHCANTPSRCAYAIREANSARPPVSLGETSYSIFAVVRRVNDRRDNYFVMTSGSGCQVWAGGTGCAANSALHLGWIASESIRHGHYDNDVDLGPMSRRGATTFPVSLIVAQSGPMFMDVALLDDSFNARATRDNPGPLTASGELFLGGTPFGVIDAPDWHFEGDIFAVLIYGRELTSAERRTVEDYLRNIFGPR